ncbi:MAG: HRDC domain-containing protein, partial [Bacteroidetes bacterium]|nr:HRDC domain-containing protein [Bacteroidota bacterium]
PRRLEAYYQETGRAGLDGLEGRCIAYYDYKDILKLEKFLRDKPVSEREIGTQLLLEISAFAETSMCRRRSLLHYFGEDYGKDNCGHCDNCLNPKEQYEGKKHIVRTLKIIKELHEKFEIQHIVNFLRGNETQQIESYKHDKLKTFGLGKDEDDNFWNAVIRRALLENLLTKEIENYGLLKVSKKGEAYLISPKSLMFSKNHEFETAVETEENGAQTSALDPTLFKMLKETRKEIAQDLNLPPFVIFQDPSLEDMATQYPTTLEDLSRITGVSSGKATRYGEKIVELIAKYVDENEIDTPDDFLVKSVVKKSGLKVFIIQSIDKRIPLDEIARSRELSMSDLLKEIESIVNSGTKVDIGYHIEDVLDEEPQDVIYDYFKTATTDSLGEAADQLIDYGYDLPEIQIMRIKFMSELAN